MKDARPKSFETTPVHRPRERTAMSQFPWMLCFSLYPFCKDPLNFYQDLGPGVTELAALRISQAMREADKGQGIIAICFWRRGLY